MSDIQVVDRTEARAQESRLRAVRDIAKIIRELKVTGFDPVLALLDKATKLDASLRERATHARDVVHTNAVPALIASGEITDEVLASFRQAAPSPDEIARLTAAVQHAVSAILRDAVTAVVAVGPATFTALLKVADAAVADAAKVAPKMLPKGHTRFPRDEATALAAGVAQSDLDALGAAYARWERAHAAYALLRDLDAVPAARAGVANGWIHYARPWSVKPAGATIDSRAFKLASAIVNGAKPGMYDLAQMRANGDAWSEQRAELLAAHERASRAAQTAHDRLVAVSVEHRNVGLDLSAHPQTATPALRRKLELLVEMKAQAEQAKAEALAERDRLDRALSAITRWSA